MKVKQLFKLGEIYQSDDGGLYYIDSNGMWHTIEALEHKFATGSEHKNLNKALKVKDW